MDGSTTLTKGLDGLVVRTARQRGRAIYLDENMLKMCIFHACMHHILALLFSIVVSRPKYRIEQISE